MSETQMSPVEQSLYYTIGAVQDLIEAVRMLHQKVKDLEEKVNGIELRFTSE